MKRYESYKDSGVKWLGEIPGHWEVTCLRRLLKRYSVKGHPNKPLLSVTREKGVILRGAKGDDGNNNIIPEDLSGYKHVKKGQFVINKMKSWQGSYGVSDFEGIVSPAYFVYDLDIADKRFFSWAIRSKNYVPFFMQYSKGIRVDQWDLTPENVKSIPFFIPPKSEQTAIANYLDSVTSKIDEAISQQQKMIDLLNERKQIIIQNAVTKGLDPNAKMKDSGVEWIGEIPEDWTKITLKRVFNTRIAGSWGNDENQGYKNTICLRIADFDYSKLKFKDSKSYTIRSYSEKEILNKSIKRGDLLIEKSGGGEKTPVGRMVVYDLDLNNPMYANFMEKLSVRYFANSYYINYIMSAFYHSRAIWPYVKATTGIQNLDITNLLANEIIFIPSLSEQLSIVNYICSKTSQIDNNIHQCNKMITLLQERKQIIINDVVTGKIKVI